jgi:hypothetical protein
MLQLQKEKIDLENQLEQEEEYIVNKLRKELSVLQQEKRYTLNCDVRFLLSTQLNRNLSIHTNTHSHSLVFSQLEKKLEEEREAREKLKLMQKEMEEIRAQMERYKKEVESCS